MIDTVRKPAKRIFGLDLLRVISIALVLCSHTSIIYPPSDSLLAKLVDMCGFFGVELFFVMSGFLIGGIIFRLFVREDFGLRTMLVFLYRRLMRILPNYYLIILINLLIWMLLDYSVAEVWKYFLLWQNFATPLLPFFPESWSLPVKEFGYIIAVLLLFGCSVVLAKVPRRTVFFAVIIGMTVFFFSTKIWYHLYMQNATMQQWDIALRSVVIYRIDTVLFGVLFGCVASEHGAFWKKQKIKFAFSGFLLLLLLAMCLGFFRFKIADSPFFWNVLCLPICGLGLVCFLPLFSGWESASKKWTRPVIFISEISYCVYLLHYSIVLFLMEHFIDTSGFSLLQLHLFTIGYLTITFTLSYLMYTYFEKPMMRLRNVRIG
jgi:peptidoglycan/LPS O-acetylase OafA/YrhL